MTPSPVPAPLRVVAVDLGASSGRVVVGTVGADQLSLQEVHRFDNGAVPVRDRLHWDVLGLFREVLVGLRAAAAAGPVQSVGIDSWAIDYGLLDSGGQLIGIPVSHRDSRTDGVRAGVEARIGEASLYDVTGLQRLPFSTLFQLLTEGTRLDIAETMLLLPDLFGYWLTGVVAAERTNASTTDMFDARLSQWAVDVVQRLGVPTRLLPTLVDPGVILGPVSDAVSEQTGLGVATPVVTVGSHDTASAVVAVPFDDPGRAAYICSGTWSLVGVELPSPVLTTAAREMDFTNEGGVDGTIRFLRNVSGLWVLSESIRTWADQGWQVDLHELLHEAASVPAGRSVIDPGHPDFLPPGDMPARIRAHCERSGQPVPQSPGDVVRCIVDSLAAAYARTLDQIGELTGMEVQVVHLVGGGARNQLLCQATADATGLPVLAGPVEASAIGNVLVQARAMGADLPDLASMRSLVRATHPAQRYRPHHAAPGAEPTPNDGVRG
ncbi:MAG: rhamnulokinase family protein [Ornithinimicrobium sp.]